MRCFYGTPQMIDDALERLVLHAYQYAWHFLVALHHPPPKKIGEEIPTNQRKKMADRFFGKRASQ